MHFTTDSGQNDAVLSGVAILEVFCDLAPVTSQYFLSHLDTRFLVITFGADLNFVHKDKDFDDKFHGIANTLLVEGNVRAAPYIVALEEVDETLMLLIVFLDSLKSWLPN